MTRSTATVVALVMVAAGCNADATRSQARPSQMPRYSGTVRMSNGGRLMPDFSKRDPVGGQIAFGLAPAAHLDGALAWLIRDASAPDPVLVVLSKESTNDKLYVIAKGVMRRDMVYKPVPDGRRVVKIFRDQHVVIEEGGQSRTAYINETVGNPSKHIGPALLRGEAKARQVQVAGVGLVHVVFEPALNTPGQFAP